MASSLVVSFAEGADFFLRFLRKPGQIGAVWPSSPQLAEQMVGSIDWSRVRTLLEYGPGTGVFTGAIRQMAAPGTRIIAIERDADMATRLRQKYADVCVYEGDVISVRQVCADHGLEHIDAIVSGLPWALFTPDVQQAILDESSALLAHGGQFATFAYLQGLVLPTGWSFRRHLCKRFDQVSTSGVVWSNLPPAFVYRCQK
jgi:phosphatidylethanolamine/phosphatidyl-N-methylethanolamine N-methyltransferase